MSYLLPYWVFFKFDFQKVDQHAGGKWLIHDTKRRKDNQLQSLKLPCRIMMSDRESAWQEGWRPTAFKGHPLNCGQYRFPGPGPDASP